MAEAELFGSSRHAWFGPRPASWPAITDRALEEAQRYRRLNEPVEAESICLDMRYEKAESMRPARNDDALLRWNTCAPHPAASSRAGPAPEDRSELPLE